MKYEGYIVIDRTGSVIGGYPRPGEAQYFTRLGNFTGDETMEGYTIVRVEGEV